MPLNVRRICPSVLLLFIFTLVTFAQTSADVMRERVAKAKAFIAVRNYGAAIYELENIRRETSDPTVNGVVNILLVNSFLEQGDYKRAQDFLTELSKKPGASASYLAAAGQVVKGARNQMERYRSLGLSMSDPKLPKDAVADVDKMRETLEKVVEQTKVLSKDKTQTSNAMALMEEATTARSGLARDDFDANRWKNEAADAREDLANSRSVVVNAVNGTTTPTDLNNTVASNTTASISTPLPSSLPQNAPKTTIQTLPPPTADSEKIIVAKNDTTSNSTIGEKPAVEMKKVDESPIVASENTTKSARNRRVEDTKSNNETKPETIQNVSLTTPESKNDSPLAVGSLVTYATQKASPIYPPMARNMRLTGIVKVELVIDEDGQVAQVQTTSGPPMLKQAATEAVKKWKFKPFMRDGQATKATGFVNFNFSL